jgi:hypothetical protein
MSRRPALAADTAALLVSTGSLFAGAVNEVGDQVRFSAEQVDGALVVAGPEKAAP